MSVIRCFFFIEVLTLSLSQGYHTGLRDYTHKFQAAYDQDRFKIFYQLFVSYTLNLSTRMLINPSGLTVWWSKWVWNDFRKPDGSPVKNKEILRYLAALLELRHVKKQKVQFVHVRGHMGIEGNEGADYQANLGSTMEERIERDWDEERENVRRKIDAEMSRGATVGPAEVGFHYFYGGCRLIFSLSFKFEVKVVEEFDDNKDIDVEGRLPGPSAQLKTEKATQTPTKSKSFAATPFASTKQSKASIDNEDDEEFVWVNTTFIGRRYRC